MPGLEPRALSRGANGPEEGPQLSLGMAVTAASLVHKHKKKKMKAQAAAAASAAQRGGVAAS